MHEFCLLLEGSGRDCTCLARLSQQPNSGAIEGIDRNVLNCYLCMLIAVSVQGKMKRLCAREERILSRKSVSVFLFVLLPTVSLDNSSHLFRPNFPLLWVVVSMISLLPSQFKLASDIVNFEVKTDLRHKTVY